MQANNLLKKACESCTKSKIKCSAGQPCKRCHTKGIECIYRPKMKRGPQKHSASVSTNNKTNGKRTPDEASYGPVSTYEKRLWGVFFTIFKNQNKVVRDASSPWGWCWFANQLEKLRLHFKNTKNDQSLHRLNAWLTALDLDIASIDKKVKTKCTFPPHLCGCCSAMALNAPNPVGVPVNPHVTLSQAELSEDEPCLVYNGAANTCQVRTSHKFTEMFQFTDNQLEDVMRWSGDGFLPWGGDLLALLIVNESDLLVFLQILALKFQSLGYPDHIRDKECVREVPTVHLIDLWCCDDKGQYGKSMRQCLVNCVHQETVLNNHLSLTMRLAVKPVGEVKPCPANKLPVNFVVHTAYQQQNGGDDTPSYIPPSKKHKRAPLKREKLLFSEQCATQRPHSPLIKSSFNLNPTQSLKKSPAKQHQMKPHYNSSNSARDLVDSTDTIPDSWKDSFDWDTFEQPSDLDTPDAATPYLLNDSEWFNEMLGWSKQ